MEKVSSLSKKASAAVVAIEPLLTTKQVAEITGMSESTLINGRGSIGLPFVRLAGRIVRYRPADVREYIEKRMSGAKAA